LEQVNDRYRAHARVRVFCNLVGSLQEGSGATMSQVKPTQAKRGQIKRLTKNVILIGTEQDLQRVRLQRLPRLQQSIFLLYYINRV
jgi:hypothetical protein